jgi:hypothetical protein
MALPADNALALQGSKVRSLTELHRKILVATFIAEERRIYVLADGPHEGEVCFALTREGRRTAINLAGS